MLNLVCNSHVKSIMSTMSQSNDGVPYSGRRKSASFLKSSGFMKNGWRLSTYSTLSLICVMRSLSSHLTGSMVVFHSYKRVAARARLL